MVACDVADFVETCGFTITRYRPTANSKHFYILLHNFSTSFFEYSSGV